MYTQDTGTMGRCLIKYKVTRAVKDLALIDDSKIE